MCSVSVMVSWVQNTLQAVCLLAFVLSACRLLTALFSINAIRGCVHIENPPTAEAFLSRCNVLAQATLSSYHSKVWTGRPGAPDLRLNPDQHCLVSHFDRMQLNADVLDVVFAHFRSRNLYPFMPHIEWQELRSCGLLTRMRPIQTVVGPADGARYRCARLVYAQSRHCFVLSARFHRASPRTFGGIAPDLSSSCQRCSSPRLAARLRRIGGRHAREDHVLCRPIGVRART